VLGIDAANGQNQVGGIQTNLLLPVEFLKQFNIIGHQGVMILEFDGW